VGDPKRIALVAADLVAHFEKRVEATRRMSNDEFGMSNWLNFGLRTSAFALFQRHRRDAGETRHRLRHDAWVQLGRENDE
jgi:hypothetical protein